MTAIVKAGYDPMSSSQTTRLTELMKDFLSSYPTVRGDSKQVREMLKAVQEKIKGCVEKDPYIPITYAKQ